MAKYRKKPVVIEAFCWRGDVRFGAPDWLTEWVSPNGGRVSIYAIDSSLEIPTLEGVMRADVGDWIIQGVKGEIYPCKPDIFVATYEPAD